MKKKAKTRSASSPSLAAEAGATYYSAYNILGIPRYSDVTDLIAHIRKGLPNSVIDRLKDLMHVSSEELASILHISSRTLARKGISDKPLNPEQTERVLELARLYTRGAEVMDTPENFREWMNTRIRTLGGKRPVDFLDTSLGIQLLLDELGRIEHGIYS